MFIKIQLLKKIDKNKFASMKTSFSLVVYLMMKYLNQSKIYNFQKEIYKQACEQFVTKFVRSHLFRVTLACNISDSNKPQK